MQKRFERLSKQYGAIAPLLSLAAASYFFSFVILFFSKNKETTPELLLQDQEAAELFAFFTDFFRETDGGRCNFPKSAYESPRTFLTAWQQGVAEFSARTAKENFFLDLCIRFDQLQSSTLSSRLLNDIRYLLFSLAMADEQVSAKEQDLLDFLEKKASRIRQSIGDTRLYDIHARDNAVLLAEARAELDELIGLEAFLRIQRLREEKKLAVADLTLHFVFPGNPGTGKTTVTRIIGKVFKGAGFLSQGQVVESAQDGILSVDEAYALSRSSSGDDNYGRETIETLLKFMENHRKRLVVVVAGYPRLMEAFVATNPVLKSRFTRYLNFADFSPEELLRIIHLFATKEDYRFSEEAETRLSVLLTKVWQNKEEGFGNARYVRNLFQEIIQNQAMRLAGQEKTPEAKQLTCIEAVDLPTADEECAAS